ncbi:MAG TPA: rhodanese-like domain-containing protein [Opitutaceae bacterium]|nr:rhodanese-like domain-containing protein [Opitutaceae bacterium]
MTEAHAWLNRKERPALLIDVREPDEIAICSINGSKKIPMGQIPDALPSLPRDRSLLILCHHGARSLRVTQFLRAKGFSEVTNVAGGIEAWALEVEPGMKRY